MINLTDTPTEVITIKLNPKQCALVLDAVEDYAVLSDEDTADDCGEIIDIIEAVMFPHN